MSTDVSLVPLSHINESGVEDAGWRQFIGALIPHKFLQMETKAESGLNFRRFCCLGSPEFDCGILGFHKGTYSYHLSSELVYLHRIKATWNRSQPQPRIYSMIGPATGALDIFDFASQGRNSTNSSRYNPTTACHISLSEVGSNIPSPVL
jgi:hypothetical protein